jgi:hypothetical protein
MNILNRFFNSGIPALELQFGRYSNVVNDTQKQSYWEYAFKMYEAKKYQDACKSLLHYLKNSIGNNVVIETQSTFRFSFEIIQGSKKILGKVNESGIFCEVKIAKSSSHDFGLYHQLLEENYYRNYTKYGLDEDGNICILFQAEHIYASPFRIYYALKDLAVTADKNDDIWIIQHPGVTPIHTEHKLETTLYEKQQKFEYFQLKYKNLISYFEENKLFLATYPGASAYLFLDFAFTMDYLIKPEGKMMRIFEDMVRSYSNNSLTNPGLKIETIRNYFEQLAGLTRDEFYSEVYPTIYTFGTPSFTNHQSVADIILSEYQNMHWYLDNQKEEIGIAIARYIAGYIFYSYTIPEYDKDFLHIIFEISENKFFKRFNTSPLIDENHKPVKKKILAKMEQIIKKNKNSSLMIEINTQSIDFSTTGNFLKSFLFSVANINVSKLKKS